MESTPKRRKTDSAAPRPGKRLVPESSRDDVDMDEGNGVSSNPDEGEPGHFDIYEKLHYDVSVLSRQNISIGSYRPESANLGNNIALLPEHILQCFVCHPEGTTATPIVTVSPKMSELFNVSTPLARGIIGWQPLASEISLDSFVPLSVGVLPSAQAIEQTTFNDAPYCYIGTDTQGAVPNIAITNVPAAKRTVAQWLDDGFIRVNSTAFHASGTGTIRNKRNGPLNLSKIETMGRGGKWSKGHSWGSGRFRNTLNMPLIADIDSPIMLPFDNADGTIKSSTVATGTSNNEPNTKIRGMNPTFIWMPFIEDIAEGANPIQLRASMNMEKRLKIRVLKSPEHWNQITASPLSSTTPLNAILNNIRDFEKLAIDATTKAVTNDIPFGGWF